MKKVLLLLLVTGTSIIGWSQTRYVDSLFTQIEKATYTYKDTLQLDVYSAKKDKNGSRPLLLVVHGGGFAGGKRDSRNEVEFSRTMAAKGYMVASMSYNLTLKGKSFGCDCPANDKIETFRSATNDIIDALHFLNKLKELAYDRNTVVLVGSSAGAEAVLNTAFLQHHFAFTDLFVEPVTISGVVSLAGAMVDANYITKENAIPTLLVHGMKDGLVPYATATHHYCKTGTKGYLMLDGARTIANRLRALDTSYLLAYAPSGTHEWSGLGYRYTDLIAGFINEAVLEHKLIQTEEDIEKLPY